MLIAPVFKDQKLIGGVAASIPLQDLLRDLIADNPEHRGHIYLIDEDNHIASKQVDSHYDEILTFRKPDKALNIVENRSEGDEPRLIQLDGVPTLVYYRPLPPTGWTLALAIPRDELMRPALKMQRWDLIFVISAVVVALAVMGLLNRTLLRPIQTLRKAHRKVSEGDLSTALTEERHDEFGELTTAFNKMVQSLAEAEKKREQTESALRVALRQAQIATDAKSHFIATMSHELRTPLQGILGATDLIDVLSSDPDVRSYIEIIRANSQNLSILINNILDISRLSAGKTPVAVERFVPRHAFASMLTKFGDKAAQKNLAFQVDLEPDGTRTFEGDISKLCQILECLLDNAIKFTPRGAVSLRMSTRPAHEAAMISVSFAVEDTGVGIPQEHLARIFDPFFQVDPDYDRSVKGPGLGLTIAAKLAELINARIEVTSTPGQGSTFTLKVTLKEVDTHRGGSA